MCVSVFECVWKSLERVLGSEFAAGRFVVVVCECDCLCVCVCVEQFRAFLWE